MKINPSAAVSAIKNMFPFVDSHVNAFFSLDGKEYEIEHFNVSFRQPVDHKGQPQSETKGGIIHINITQGADYNLYDWAKRENKRKNGKVLFRTETAGTVLEVVFTNANCIRLTRSIDSFSGTKTSLVIAPEKVSMNGITHENKWRE
ncbi:MULTISPECIES: type VI secretion system tube protein TssD [unclassified Dysgonomonas]|uniref:type VI secretion system tube protein TssD n=1 Tax=unclassified Dysgonomonas TaxID=2630389 RepID=UPI0013EB8E45|nr:MULTISPECIES: type VI secretion system tube protein TssD [unclassified Dysgonomonas]